MKTLCKPENEMEAIAITALLEAHSIQSSIQSLRDTAYGSVYQAQYGWGVIKINEADYDAAIELLTRWKSGTPDTEEMTGKMNQE
jgi:hypothetical protein